MLSPSTRLSGEKANLLGCGSSADHTRTGGAAEGKTVQGMAWRTLHMCSHSLQFKTKF